MSQPVLKSVDVVTEPSSHIPLSLVSLLSALSYALDLTEGQPMGHSVRTSLIGLEIARTLGLSEREQDQLHLALLLKDSGCSSNAARMHSLFGCDDIAAKSDAKFCDWCRVSEGILYALRHTLPKARLTQRLGKLRELSRLPARVMDILTETRCTEGAEIARLLGLGESVADTIYCLDEHWDGQGAPRGLRGEQIPILARIACLAQTMEVFATHNSVAKAYDMARERAGRWFDPQVVQAASGFEHDQAFWDNVRLRPRAQLAAITGRALQTRITETSLDAVCSAFARIVDAKSSYTAAHSSRVTFYANHIARNLELSSAERATVRRASLLHDLGKLAVPNHILDKPGALTDEEFHLIQKHPYHTERILSQIPSFERVTEVAAAHHERLDGSGYFRGLSGSDLTPPMRLLAVADVFDALTAHRPYRASLPVEHALAIIEADVNAGKLDADSFAALKQGLPEPEHVERIATRLAVC